MIGKRRSSLRLLIIVICLLFVAAVVAFTALQSAVPHQQVRTAMPGMGEHLVNLWTDPSPPQVGLTELVVQIADPVQGRPLSVDGVVFFLAYQGDPPIMEVPGSRDPDSVDVDEGFVAVVNLNRPGLWQMTVEFEMLGSTAQADFEIQVEEGR